MTLVDAARQLAQQHLEPVPALADRWAHVQAAAERAREVARTVPEEDRELLVSAAWLHDIGYAPTIVETGFHPIDGARYVQGQGFGKRLAGLVAHHSGARYEAAERNLIGELDEWPLEDSAVMDALVAADLTTGPAGQRLTFDERIDEILTRYPGHTAVHRAISRARPVLQLHVRRVGERLDAAQPI